MARPRESMKRVFPGLAQETHAITHEDMGVQAINASLAANSAGAVNIILNSLLTSNVAWQAHPMAGFSGEVSYSEATDPTRSAIFISVYNRGASLGITNNVIPTRVYIFQRED